MRHPWAVASAVAGVFFLLVRKRFALARYRPGSPEQIALFEAAARKAGHPVSWARSPGLVKILEHESGGWVGQPNETYGKHLPRSEWPRIWAELRAGIRSAKVTATGLGQCVLENVDKYYPNGRRGIGDALSEAVGMLNYIKARYGDPDAAGAHWAPGKGY